MPYDVLCVGSATIDVFIDYAKRTKDIKLGEKVLIENLEKHTGGGANNPATALSKMGLKVKALFKVGHDHDGELITKELKQDKVKCLEVIDKHHRTSFSAILSSTKESDRVLYTFKGASDHLEWKDINKNQLKDIKWIYMATLLKKSFQTAIKIANYTKQNNIQLLFNPSSYLAKKGKNFLKPILKATTILVLNREEAKKLLQTKSNNIKTLSMQLMKLGPKLVIITEGKKGVNAYDNQYLYHAKPYKVKITHTAGAGDAFTSAFLAVYLKTKNIEKALKFGNANSASVIQHYGTKHKLLTWKEAERFTKKHHTKLTKKKCLTR
ncbi:MAG: carbohydrate kinase family protein [Nanoarchaeota archaeon]|nr:carbohydrate kinase family protein [Nanoarchaeota archaeon]